MLNDFIREIHVTGKFIFNFHLDKITFGFFAWKIVCHRKNGVNFELYEQKKILRTKWLFNKEKKLISIFGTVLNWTDKKVCWTVFIDKTFRRRFSCAWKKVSDLNKSISVFVFAHHHSWFRWHLFLVSSLQFGVIDQLQIVMWKKKEIIRMKYKQH